MAEFSFVKSALLQEQRLDSEYYSRKYVANAEKIESAEHVITLEEIRKKETPIRRGIDMPIFVDDSASPFMVTIASFDDPGVDFSQLKRVSLEQHESFRGSHIKPGDLLVAMGGYAGKAALCPEDTPVSNIGRHTARVSVDTAVADERYIWAFIRSKIGVLQFERYITGSVQAGINLEDIRAISISLPAQLAQKYIGNKVRQAEQLRAWAKGLENQLSTLQDLIPINKPKKTEDKFSTAPLSFLTDNRLDARFYENRHLELAEQFNEDFSKLGVVCRNFKYGASVSADYISSGGIPFIRGNALAPNDINGEDIVQMNNVRLESLGNSFVEEGDILITRSGSVGVVCDVQEQFSGAAYGSFIIKCKIADNNYSPEYLSWFLNSWVGQQQFRRWENGAVQLNINIEELSSIYIWSAPIDLQETIKNLLFSQRQAKRLSKSLTSAAKFLVEALIEGQLTEQQLIEAQQALDAGNNTLDKTILAQLTSEGKSADLKPESEANHQPLFSDLDELYCLLAQANEAAND